MDLNRGMTALWNGSNFWVFVDKILSVTIQMKAAEQYFLVLLFIMLHKGVVNLIWNVFEIFICD